MILCCGEALIDMIPDHTGTGAGCLVPTSGGAAFNTAIALGRLGAPVGMFTGVSDDLFGQQLRADLAASHVDCTALATLNAPTSLAFVALSKGHAQYTFYTQGAADTILTAEDCPQSLSPYNAMLFGGISLCKEPTASTLKDLQNRASQDCVTMIDPNIRPSFITDEAAYRARIGAMMRTADIVKLSDEDLAWIAQDTEGMTDQIAALALAPSTLLLITEGAKGATAFRGPDRIAHAASLSVQVADTIAAGDTFNAGFLSALASNEQLNKATIGTLSDEDVADALHFANQCAAVTVSRQGANPPWRHELP